MLHLCEGPVGQGQLSHLILVEFEQKCCTGTGHCGYRVLGNHMLLISLVQMLSKDTDEADTAGMIRQPQSLAFVIIIFLSTDNKQAGMALITFPACYKQHATMNNLTILVNTLLILQMAFLLLVKATSCGKVTIWCFCPF